MNYELWLRWEDEAAEADAKLPPSVDLSQAPTECESPIERRLAVFLSALCRAMGFQGYSQFKHDRFRYDFAIEKEIKLLLLLNAMVWDFHSSPEQLSNDVVKDLSARRRALSCFDIRARKFMLIAERCAEEIIFLSLAPSMKWYKHDPAAFLEGVIGLTAEERGFYITLIDLLYARDGHNVTDELVCSAMRCNPRTWRAVKSTAYGLWKSP